MIAGSSISLEKSASSRIKFQRQINTQDQMIQSRSSHSLHLKEIIDQTPSPSNTFQLNPIFGLKKEMSQSSSPKHFRTHTQKRNTTMKEMNLMNLPEINTKASRSISMFIIPENTQYLQKDLLPPLLKGDLIFSNLKSLGEKKQVTDTEAWLESVYRKISADANLDMNGKIQCLKHVFVKSIEALSIFINRDHEPVARSLQKILSMIFECMDFLLFEKQKAFESQNTLQYASTQELGAEGWTKKKSLCNECSSLKLENERLQQKVIELEPRLNLNLEKTASSSPLLLSREDSEMRKSFRIILKQDVMRGIQTDFSDFQLDKACQCESIEAPLKTKEVDLKERTTGIAFVRNKKISHLEDLVRAIITKKVNLQFDKDGIRELKEDEESFNTNNKFKRIDKKKTTTGIFTPRSLIKMSTVNYSDLKEEIQSLQNVIRKYEGETETFYDELKKFLTKLESVGEVIKKFNLQNLRDAIEKNKTYNEEFYKTVGDRDIFQNEESLLLKIEIAEKAQLLSEQENINKNWQRRFDKFFHQYQRVKEFLTHEQENRDKLIVNYLNNNKGVPNDVQKLLNRLKETQKETFFQTSTQKPSHLSQTIGKVNHMTRTIGLLSSTEVPANLKHRKIISGSIYDVLKEFYVKGVLLIENPLSVHNKKKIIRNIFCNNFSEASKFIRDVREIPLNPCEELKQEHILKVISGVYSILIKQSDRRENQNPLYFFVYDYLMNSFGGNTVQTDQRFRHLIGSCLNLFEKLPKIRMFLRLLTILYHDIYEFDGEELNIYLEFMKKLDCDDQKEQGLALASNSNEQTLVPLKAAIDIGISFLKASEDLDKFIDLTSFESEIANAKILHPHIKARFFIDFDFFVEKCLFWKYDYQKSRLEVLFNAVDIDKHCHLGIEQFLLLFNLFHPKTYSFRTKLRLFSNHVDMIDEDENKNFISFKKFSSCVEKENLFKPSLIENLLNSTADHIMNLKNLELEWHLKRTLIKLKLIKSNSYNILVQKILKSIDDFFPLDSKDPDCDLIWMRYRILDSYSNSMYLEFLITDFLPDYFDEISLVYKKLAD